MKIKKLGHFPFGQNATVNAVEVQDDDDDDDDDVNVWFNPLL